MNGEIKNPGNTGLEIAVIGMAGRFPGSRHIDEFWQNLKNGDEAISFFTQNELEQAGLGKDILESPNYIKARGFLQNLEDFDAHFFDYTPLEAELMDPQVRIFHECAWEALENSAYVPDTYDRLIGIYAGASANFMWEALTVLTGKGNELGSFSVSQLMDKDFLCTRLAHKLNLKGPSVTLNTSCSTSLVAIHIACQGLLAGDCDIALAGGITTNSWNKSGYLYEEGMIYSPDGHCRAFAAGAKGAIAGNGAGVVVLKRLEEAIAQRDTIAAVIKGSAINNDGIRKAGFTAPSIEGQAAVILSALQTAEIDPESIGYIETHGTGTPLGDPVEIEGLTLAFKTEKKGFCRIGSVKTNIGHLDFAAGIAGFIKTVLTLKHRLIPPSLHFEKPNPTIEFADTPFKVNTRLEPWEPKTYPLRAGVSSFGIGGTNAHVILEEAPPAPRSAKSRDKQILVFSAKTQTALDTRVQTFLEYCKSNPGINLPDAAYTLQVGRKEFQVRKAALVSGPQDLIQRFDPAAQRENQPSPEPGKVYSSLVKEEKPTVWMFSGQGAQYVNMGRELYETETCFRRETDRCFEILRTLTSSDFKEILYPAAAFASDRESPPTTGPKDINQTEITQPVIFLFEYALGRLLQQWGITPRAMIGHSIGEFVAACLAGVFSLEDALKLVHLRGQLMQRMPSGGMLSVPLGEDLVKTLLSSHPHLDLAAVNSPSLCVVSGPPQAIHSLQKQLQEDGHECRPLHTSHAFHSRMMTPMAKEFATQVGHVKLHTPRIPFISNVTGGWITFAEATDPAYWAAHLLSTVRFADGMTEIFKDKNVVLMEVGPGKTLTTFARQHPDTPPALGIVNLIKHPREKSTADDHLLNKIAQLWSYGVKIDWEGFYGDERRSRIPLPTYPFQRQPYRMEGNLHTILAKSFAAAPPLKKKPDLTDWFYQPTWKWKFAAISAAKTAASPGQHPWLLFANELPLCSQLLQRLKQENNRVITVETGPRFRAIANDRCTLQPTQPGHYEALLHELVQVDKVPGKIVHFWNVTGKEREETGIDDTLDLGFFSLLYLAQAIGKQNLKKEIQITVVTDNMQEVSGDDLHYPGKAAILGPVMVIPQEYPGIVCKSVDIYPPAPGSAGEQRLLDQLLAELNSRSPDPIIAYRGAYRQVKTYDPLHLDKPLNPLPRLQAGGVYLITGGLGGIGLEFAKLLAGCEKTKLILTGRSPFPGRETWEQWLQTHDPQDPISGKIGKLQELESLGADLLIFNLDASDEREMQAMVNQAEKHFGTIKGVIHCAGIPGGGLIQRKNRETAEAVLAPKIKGTLVLDKILGTRPLDFFISSSSINSVFPVFGQVDYFAANAFLDAFAYYKRSKDGTFAVAINWDAWQEVGMAAAQLDKEENRHPLRHQNGILPAEGVEVFKYIMNSTLPQVVVSTTDLVLRLQHHRTLKQELLEKENREMKRSAPKHDRPELNSSYQAPRFELEEKIAVIWQEFLGLKKVGIYDDFFELGGDSLKAITIAARIHKETDTEIPIAEFFNRPTIKGLAEYVKEAVTSAYISILPVEKKEYYPLSSPQKRLYILQQFEEKSIAYNLFFLFNLGRDAAKDQLESILKKIIARHDSLRASFRMVEDEPVQIIHNQVNFTLEYFEADAGEVDRVTRDFLRPFDLGQAPLLRAALLYVQASYFLLILDLHHIITDENSQHILKNEFSKLQAGKQLPPLKIQYKEYVRWRDGEQQKAILEKQQNYWLNRFQGELPLLNLPLDFTRPTLQSFEGGSVSFWLPADAGKALNKVAQEEGTTVFMTVLTVFYIVLSRLSGQEEILVGVPIEGRDHEDLEKIIGMFVNTLVIRCYPEGSKGFKEFLGEVKTSLLAAFENQHYPFEDLVDNLLKERAPGRNPIFDVMINLLKREELLQDLPETEINDTFVHQSHTTAMFDMNCLVVEYGQTLYFLLKYSSKLFKPDTVERMARYFRNALAEVAAHKERHLAEIQITSPRERDKLLYHLNQTGTALPREKSIQHVFEKQVRKSPDSIAIICADKRLTYRQLNQKSEQTAHLLKGKGLGPDIVAGLMTERSAEAIIGVLGILKAGGAYLPLDPQYPEERIAYILADSGARVLLTGHATTVKVKEKLLEIVDISGFLAFAAPAPSPSSEEAHGTNLAYVIYTSGSTGRPKGVMIEHTSVLRLVINSNYIDLKETDRILPTGAFVFDIATFETWWPLLHGISMYIEPKDTILEPGTLGNLLVKNNITVLHLTPQLFNQLAARDIGIFAGLRVFLVGGDLVTPGYVNLLKNTCRHLKILHMYGPTENTTFSTFFEVDRDYGTGIPLGKPISNSTVYILDKNLNLQPLGVAGELCVGGSGVARGYLNQPELTFEKFCLRRAGGSFCKNRPLHPHKNVLSGTPAQPAHPRTDATVYLTGDLARWLPEENIEFLGRMDHQLKIRGIRVEIHEIQNRLLSHEEVKEAVVVDREDSTGDKYLCAYIVPLSNRVMGEIKGFLSRSLPDYMIPAYFLELESLPLTPNGKLDRKRLPQPLFAQGENHYPPRTRTERKLAEIWSGILARDPLPAPFSPGIDDNFFELGGHSLKAIILAAKIHKEFNVKLPLAKIFAFPTIRELAERIETSAQYKYITVAAAEKKEYYPLSPAQKRLFFLQQMDLHSIAYNMPYLLPVKKGTAKEKLEEIFAKLISRHEILRTSFTMLDGEPVQQVHPRVEFSLHSHNREPEPRLRPSPPDRPPGIKDFVRPFALSRPPLLRAALLDIDGPEPTGGTARLLLIDIHHILTDGISEKILRDEFAALSSHRELAPTRIQYKDYSQWQKTQTRKNELRLQEEYWLREFQEEIPPLNLPLDYRRPAPRSLEGHSIAFELGENETGTLNALARAQGVTLFMLLLAIFNVLLAKLSNQEDVIVGTPTAGRRHPDLERVIGMFVNTLVLRNFPADEKKFVRFLADLRQRTLEAFENQDYQFEELVEKVVKGRDVRHNPLFDVMFDLRNIYETSPPGTEEETGKSPENKGENPDSKNLLSISKFDLILSAFEDRRKLFLTFRYGSKLFKRQTILGFIAYFRNLVAAIIQDPQRQIETLEIITGEERKRLLYDFNDAQADYPQDKVIQQLFAEQSRRVPHATALVGTGVQELTYGELNRKADRLGWFLRNKGVGPDTIVGIMVHPSPEMILWIMAILKAGGAYMPISPEYPAERKKLMLSESRVKWLLSREPNPGHFPETCEVVNPETLDLPAGVEKKPGNLNTPGDLAYTLYTSGSTGNPKGMLISHRNVVRLLFNDKFPFAFKEDDVWTLFHSFCFDFSVWEMYGALLYGGKLVIVPQPVARDTEKFLGLLKRQQVTVLNQTPAAFYNLVNLELKQSQRELRIRYVIFGGEALAPAMLREWYAAYPATRLINMYGITETTVHVTLKEITSAEIATNTGNIGKPIPTMSIYLIGKSLRLIPPGVAGELCVGGDGVGRGYLNRPELSAEKFISLSYLSPAAKNKLYRSGDLARWLAHGELEYLGRIDRQVKIRGYRIELAEIESQLANYENITKVIVRTRDSNPEAPRKYSSPNDNTGEYGDKYLCAYFVATKRIEAAPLKEYLAGRLPAYMIPAYFLQLEKMPLTLNGKIDRKALPDPKKIPGIIGWDKNNRLPENETEEKIRQIWGEVLGIAPQTIGVEEDFFELGGNSINILKVANIIGHQLEVELALGELFLSPTIRALATRIQQETMRQNLESVVKLSESTSPKNMFILHQGEGLIYPYKKLAALLEDELNVYGIQAKGLFQKSQLPENMEMMLAHYLREIKIVQPQGPYLIAGYCMGNRIAYELVRCLEDGNDAVTKLIIFNTAPFISEFRLRRLRLKESVLKTVTRGSASPRIKTRAIPSPREDNTPIAPEEIEKRKEEVRNNLAAINEKYKPQRIINTPIVVLKAHANPNPKCNAASWSKMTTAGATVIETPGGHNTMFSIPFVNKMAKRITKIIRGVER